jgi:hypothetical protein
MCVSIVSVHLLLLGNTGEESTCDVSDEIEKKHFSLKCFQIVDKALLLQGFAIVGTAFLI